MLKLATVFIRGLLDVINLPVLQQEEVKLVRCEMTSQTPPLESSK